MDFDEIKARLVSAAQIVFGPHAEEQIAPRVSGKREVLYQLRNPSALRECTLELGKLGDDIHRLVFELSDGLLIIPVIFTVDKIFIVTVIRRYRK